MPGNELKVAEYLFNNLGKISLPHIGVINSIGSPISNSKGYYAINSLTEVRRLSSDDSSKKADLYLNGAGVSVKQSGSIFGFNRLQRAEAPTLFQQIGFTHIDDMLAHLDAAVKRFHEGGYQTRSRPWRELFGEDDFRVMLDYLMMKGSPKTGLSKHPAKYIMTAGSGESSANWHIELYSFDEYFELFKDSFTIGIRRSWYGQLSDSEHGRAKGLINKAGNAPWVFNSVSGEPKDGWRSTVPPHERKTAYYLMFETLERAKQLKRQREPKFTSLDKFR